MKKVVLLVNNNIDGLASMMIVRKAIPNVKVYYVNSHNEGSTIVNKVLGIEKGLDELIMCNIKLSTYNVTDLNSLKNTGVDVNWFGYLFRPTALEGNVKYCNGVPTCELLKVEIENRGLEVLEDFDKYYNFVNNAMFYEGKDEDISYMEGVGSLVKDLTLGLSTLTHNKLYDVLVETIVKTMFKHEGNPSVYYLGRSMVAKELVSRLNLGISEMVPIPTMLLMTQKSKDRRYISKSGLKTAFVCNMFNFNNYAKSLSDVDVVINLTIDGMVVIRTKVLNALQVAGELGANNLDRVNATRAWSMKEFALCKMFDDHGVDMIDVYAISKGYVKD